MIETEYHWPDRAATTHINELLSLPANGQEQDWEIELSDPERVVEFAALLTDRQLNLEQRSALALLALCSYEEAVESNMDTEVAQAHFATAFDLHPVIFARMKTYFSRYSYMREVGALLNAR